MCEVTWTAGKALVIPSQMNPGDIGMVKRWDLMKEMEGQFVMRTGNNMMIRLGDGAVWPDLGMLHHVSIELATKGTEVKMTVR